mmetsp:Transcript_49717/g.74110  ORF Transcript_49717/g.74110 Transcript_49717/m.74110 type:complete len:242 (-) Transcript_49717:1979-2704(-)
MMTDIPVSTPEKEQEQVEDPWAAEDKEVAEQLSNANSVVEDGTAPIPTVTSAETEEAISKLKASSANLGTAISSTTTGLSDRIGLSGALSSLNQGVKQVDEQAHISMTVASTAASVGSWLSQSITSVNEKYQISEKSQKVASSVTQKSKELVDHTGVGEVLKQGVETTSRTIHTLDEQHGITKQTATALASGADLLTNSIAAVQISDESEAGEEQEETEGEQLDSDGLPTSFSASPKEAKV